MKNLPEVITKFSKQIDPLEKLPWDSYRLSFLKKKKGKVWIEFGIIPRTENYQNALSKMNMKYWK